MKRAVWLRCGLDASGATLRWFQENQEFDWKVFDPEEDIIKRKKLARLQNLAATSNYQLVPNQ